MENLPASRRRRSAKPITAAKLIANRIVITSDFQCWRGYERWRRCCAKVTDTAPTFSAALRGCRQAQAAGDRATGEAILAWLAGRPNAAAAAKRYCAFYEGPRGIQRLEPLAQRLHVDFQTDARFDNPRAPQIRLPAFNLERLCLVGCKVRDIYQQHAQGADRIGTMYNDGFVQELARAVAGKLSDKIGVAPRIFLKKLVSDVLDRVAQFPDFNPREHYQLTRPWIGDSLL